ncbi:hypothetical protein LCGC14_0899420 [marine sediment metagenome]|uniref:Uncharacterized protein n=1 Tax=marine sediment metagenome TaxID=412755 RepID=A0A0F9NWT2_9ZZZZ
MALDRKERRMKKLLTLLFALALMVPFAPVFAQMDAPEYAADGTVMIGRTVVGARMFTGRNGVGAATTDTFDFGMQSRYVRLCLEAGSTPREVAYFRFGHTIGVSTGQATDDGTGMTIFATTSAAFINGTIDYVGGTAFTVLAGSALPLTGGGDGTDLHCVTQPWETRGLILHSATAGTATVDVWAIR